MFFITQGDFSPEMEAWITRVGASRDRARDSGKKSTFTGEIDGHKLSVREDTPDLRDWWYRPNLRRLEDERLPAANPALVRDQKDEGACTGMALAAVLDRLRGGDMARVSERMLYEMARRHDEWEGEVYEGSSVRGAVKGFYHNGVCLQDTWPYDPAAGPGVLTFARAAEARNISLGAYYRLQPDINHYHAALNEVDAIIVSAWVHPGWAKEAVASDAAPWGEGVIRLTDQDAEQARQMHAFAIVGYTPEGFLVQNSWGPDWGRYRLPGRQRLPGVALWTYQDWAQNIGDAWVLRLGVSTPSAFGIRPKNRAAGALQGAKASAPETRRKDIAHHFVHISEGRLVDRGLFPNTAADLEYLFGHMLLKDRRQLEKTTGAPITRLLLFANGGMLPTEAAAARIADLKPGFLRNGVYPLHILWGTGPIEELFELFVATFRRVFERMGKQSTHTTDKAIEKVLRFGGRALWREIRQEAKRALDDSTPMLKYLKAFIAENHASKSPLEIHFTGYSAGAHMVGQLLFRLLIDDEACAAALTPHLGTLSLLAPACSVEFGRAHIFEPLHTAAPDIAATPERAKIYALSTRLENRDNLGPYQGSILQFISRVLEQPADAPDGAKEIPVLGLEADLRDFLKATDWGPWTPTAGISSRLGGGDDDEGSATDCTAQSHHHFLADAATLNDMLRRMGEGACTRPFRQDELHFGA